MSIPEAFRAENDEPAVRGFLHRPDHPNGNGLVLAHGAGSNCNTPLLVTLAEAFTGAGFTVLRCDLPFRQNKPSGPPMGTAALDQAGLRNAVVEMKELVSGKVFLGGHSYGGRQSTMLCANDPGLVEGLLLLSYPLHPPRKPDQMRTQHFSKLQTPSLFVHGTRDPFGSIEEMQEALKLIAARHELLPVEGAGHDLGVKGKSKTEELTSKIYQNFQSFFR
jgi:predicted alpha/beta-hydrolase family hydrolase